MKNKNPILVLTGLSIAAAAAVAGLTRDQWMGSAPQVPASQQSAPAPAPAVIAPATAPAEAQAPAANAPAALPAEAPAPAAGQPAEPAPQAAEQPAAAPAAEQAAAQQPVAQQPAAPAPAEQAAANAEAKPKVPAFDTVRVEKTGEAVIAGTAEAGSDVVVKLDGQEIGKTTANDNGDFVLTPDKPLPEGSGALTIEAKGKGDLNPTASEQSVAVIVPAGQQQTALVAVVSPDAPTKVLQKPEAVAEPASAAPADQAAAQPAAGASAEPPAQPAKLVSIDAVDYDTAGNIVFSGQGEKGNTARIYIDNQFVGDAPVGEDGRWTFSGTEKVAEGVHTLRVDGLDGKGSVVNRVEVPFFREPQAKVAEASQPATVPAAQTAQPEATQTQTSQQEAGQAGSAASAGTAAGGQQATGAQQAVAAQTPPQAPAAGSAAEPAAPAVSTQTAAAGQSAAGQSAAAAEAPQPAVAAPAAEAAATADQPAAAPAATAPSAQPQPAAVAAIKEGRIVIQPGNNLWRLSRVLYGTGKKYTVLYKANKDQIRSPKLIYPGQVFRTPDVAPKFESIDPKRREPLKPEENGALTP